MNLYTVLNMFGDSTRLRMFSIMHHGYISVNDLSHVLGLNQANVSKHLKKMYQAEMLSKKREKQFIYYTISDNFRKECQLCSPILEIFNKYEDCVNDYKNYEEHFKAKNI